jgi:hypothetical protein
MIDGLGYRVPYNGRSKTDAGQTRSVPEPTICKSLANRMLENTVIAGLAINDEPLSSRL